MSEPATPSGGCPAIAIASAQLLAWLRDPDTAARNLPGYRDLDLKTVWAAMRADHAESLAVCDQDDWPATFIAGLEALLEAAGPQHGSATYRHRKRGTTYSLAGIAALQASAPVAEGCAIAVYVGDVDGGLWVRPEEEFFDGRFEPLHEEAAPLHEPIFTATFIPREWRTDAAGDADGRVSFPVTRCDIAEAGLPCANLSADEIRAALMADPARRSQLRHAAAAPSWIGYYPHGFVIELAPIASAPEERNRIATRETERSGK